MSAQTWRVVLADGTVREVVVRRGTRAQARIRGRIADGRVLRELHDASLERGERA